MYRTRIITPIFFSFLFSWLLHGIQTVLHMLQVSLGYMLMLCVMSYNTWIFLGVIVGSVLGYFISFPLLGRIWWCGQFRRRRLFCFFFLPWVKRMAWILNGKLLDWLMSLCCSVALGAVSICENCNTGGAWKGNSWRMSCTTLTVEYNASGCGNWNLYVQKHSDCLPAVPVFYLPLCFCC